MKRRDDFYNRVITYTGIDFGGGARRPPEAKTFRYVVDNDGLHPVTNTADEYQVFASNNDGMELWLGYRDQWKYHMSTPEVKALFWWILWEWYVKARWFGLRRPIYYWALRKSIRKSKKNT